MESGLIITLSSLGCGVVGLIITVITLVKKWLKEKKDKILARAEIAEKKIKLKKLNC